MNNLENDDLSSKPKEKEEINIDDLLNKLEEKCQQIDDSINEIKEEDQIDDSINEIKEEDQIDDSINEIKEENQIDDSINEIKEENQIDKEFIDEEFIDEYDDEDDDFDFSIPIDEEESDNIETNKSVDLDQIENLVNESYDDEFNPYKIDDLCLNSKEDLEQKEENSMEKLDDEALLEEIVYSSCRALIPVGPLIDLTVNKQDEVNFDFNPYYKSKKIKRNYKTLIISLSTLITFVIMIILVFVILKFLK